MPLAERDSDERQAAASRLPTNAPPLARAESDPEGSKASGASALRLNPSGSRRVSLTSCGNFNGAPDAEDTLTPQRFGHSLTHG